jgi:hypothetical protein
LRALERIIKEQLYSHFLSNGFINGHQYGFMHKRSVASCQTHLLSVLANAHNENKSAIVVYLDIRKAFDQVPHEKLLEKLGSAGIHGSLLRWFSSYLSGRTQSTFVSGYLSSHLPISSGVLQGSVLGPCLFLLYVNDLFNYVQNGTVFLFADDIKIVYIFPQGTLDSCLFNIQEDLNALSLWSQISGLEFSANKCQILPFRCLPPRDALSLYGSPIPVTDNTIDLGLRYSCSLNFTNQAIYQVARAKQLSYLILRSFHLEITKVAFFKQRIRPILEYCPYIASLLTKQSRLAIEGVQRRFTKMLFPLGSLLCYQERCEILRLEPLWLRRLKLNLAFLHRLLYHHAHMASERPCFSESSSYNLRNTELTISCSLSRTAFHRYSFIPFYSHVWNRLPADLRMISDIYVFQKRLNTFLNLESVYLLLAPQQPLDTLFELGPFKV